MDVAITVLGGFSVAVGPKPSTVGVAAATTPAYLVKLLALQPGGGSIASR